MPTTSSLRLRTRTIVASLKRTQSCFGYRQLSTCARLDSRGRLSLRQGAGASIGTRAGPPCSSLAGGLFAGRVDFVAILILGPDEEAFKRCRSAVVDHSLTLPDHAALANAGVRKRRAVVT